MTTGHPYADALRSLCLVGGGVILGQTLLILRHYARSWRRSRSSNHQWRGLLPAHVVFIAASYIIAGVLAIMEVYERVHMPMTWRVPVALTMLALGIGALRQMLRHQRLVREALPGKVRRDESLSPEDLRDL